MGTDMKFDSLQEMLTHDHQYCDRLFADTEAAVARDDFAAAATGFARFRETTERHLSVEEKLLFPKFEDKTGMRSGPTEVMRTEHQMMRELFDKMQAALERREAKQYLGLAETLLMLLQQHNVKEENMLYPMMEQALTPEKNALIAELEANGVGGS